MIRGTFRLPLLIVLLAFVALADQAPQSPATAKLILVVVEGEGAINNLKQRTSRDTIVQVEDENHKPVAGAAVVFLLPNDGPGGTFAGGAKTAALVTDANGQAVMPRLTANQVSGRFQIRVTATLQGRQASIAIAQSNAAEAAPPGSTPPAHRGISGKVIGILAGVAAAGAVGAALALRGGGSTTSLQESPAPPTGSITGPTGGSLGPPH